MYLPFSGPFCRAHWKVSIILACKISVALIFTINYNIPLYRFHSSEERRKKDREDHDKKKSDSHDKKESDKKSAKSPSRSRR